MPTFEPKAIINALFLAVLQMFISNNSIKITCFPSMGTGGTETNVWTALDNGYVRMQ